MIVKSNSNYKDHYSTIPVAKDENIHVALNDQKEATFLCNNCGNSVTRNLSKFLHAPTAIRVKCKCKCGHVFRVLVERRRNHRKNVDFLGMCHFRSDSGNTQKRLINILDISRAGLQFSVNDMAGFTVGDTVFADFSLDNRNHTEMKVKGAIKRMRSKTVGIEFITVERQKMLNLYLLN